MIVTIAFDKATLLETIDRALDAHDLTTALRLARECYDRKYPFTAPQLLLLSVAFGANVDVVIGHDLEAKQLCYALWSKAIKQAARTERDEIAHAGIRLAEIYMEREERQLAWSALHKARPFVSFGSTSMHFNMAVDRYQVLFNKPDTDLWID